MDLNDWVFVFEQIVRIFIFVELILTYKRTLEVFGQCWQILRQFWQLLRKISVSAFLQWLDEKFMYEHFEISQFTETGDENPLYRKAFVYMMSLRSLEDSFLGAKLSWFFLDEYERVTPIRLAVRIRRWDKSRILPLYLQYVEHAFEYPEVRRQHLRIYTNTSFVRGQKTREQTWRSMPFTHPATFETVAMDPDFKSRIREDLESFLNGCDLFHNLGRVWRRSYLLYGAQGTGKSTFAAAMARFLGFDVYDFDLIAISRLELHSLLAKTTPKSLILIENLDMHFKKRHLREVVSLMAEIFACCGEERVMVFTICIDSDEWDLDPALVRRERLDVHVHLPMCDFGLFKELAAIMLGIREHRLFPEVEAEFKRGGWLSPADVGGIMITNRESPTRAIKNVISVLKMTYYE